MGPFISLWRVLQSAAEYLTEFGNARSLGLTDAGVLYSAVLRAGADISVRVIRPNRPDSLQDHRFVLFDSLPARTERRRGLRMGSI